MSKRILRSAVAASLAFSLTACGDDNGLGPAIQLTEVETQEMLEVLGVLAFDGSFGIPGQASAAMATLRNPGIALLTVNVDETLPCPVSGSRHTTGTATINDDETQITANVTQSYANCAASSESGTLWTFNTAPNLTLGLNATNNPTTGAISLTMSFNGAFQVSSDDGRTGSCVITMNWNMSGNENDQTLSASVSGTVCGREVSQSIEIS